MEALYKKLYDKFTKLKERRFTELDNVNDELEGKFTEYVSAADGFIEQLKGENEKLRTDMNDLRNEAALLRSAKDQQYDDLQQLLVEERQKNRQLSQEIIRLQKLQEEGLRCHEKTQQSDTSQHTPILLQDQSTRLRRATTSRKHSRPSKRTDADSLSASQKHPRVLGSSLIPLSREKETIYDIDHQQAECCTRSTGDSGACNCLFQVLVECLVGMKLYIVKQSDRICISALHQSSGYSFSLTWVKKVAAAKDEDEDTELLYQVSTLGTFERIASDWMKEVIVFSISMCPLFFERISRVIVQC